MSHVRTAPGVDAEVAFLSRRFPWIADEIADEIAVLRIESDARGLDEAWVLSGLRKFVAGSTGLMTGDTPLDMGAKVVPLPEAVRLSPSKAKKWRRNLVIQVALKSGLSQRLVADAFGLPRSLVASISRRDLRAEIGPRGKEDR